MKILILCTGNSCRSQMAHGFMESFDPRLQVFSAGTEASGQLNAGAVQVMKETGIDISHHSSDSVEHYLDQHWDYVITVCGGANENCPVFPGKVKHRLHIGFDDPSHAQGTEQYVRGEFLRVRDQIRQEFYKLYSDIIKPELDKQELKHVVKEKYDRIAASSGGCGCCSGNELDYTVFSESYHDKQGYSQDADLGLGCGIPTEFAALKKGEKVLDLGSGAGNDCFVARAEVGESGHVTGLDFSEEMLEKAWTNLRKLGYTNVDFVKGDIEDIPKGDNSYDVIISNCVLNLVPDKQKAFGEMMRVLRPGGRFCVSDVVIKGELPEKLQKDAEMYAGCVAGAISLDEYLEIVANAGFYDVTIHKQRSIQVPDNILELYLDKQEISEFKDGYTGIFSITVSGIK
jgi:arsenite methyltransferase